MRVYISAHLRSRMGGWAAHDTCLGLTGHGIDKESALDSLQRAVSAWCAGLNRSGYLETALSRKKLDVDRNGDGIVVIVRPVA